MSEKHYPYFGGSFDRIIFDGDGSAWVPEGENAKLREKAQRQANELTALRKAIEQRNGELRPWKRQAERLVAENAELRELVLDIYGELVSCEDNGYICGGHKFDKRVCDLGIEVD